MSFYFYVIYIHANDQSQGTLNKQISIASSSTHSINLLQPLPSAQTHIKKAEWRVVSKENNLQFYFCCPALNSKFPNLLAGDVFCVTCCFQWRRRWQCVWVMSMTQHKRCVANLALHLERQSHFNQGYWAGVCLGRQAGAFKDLTNKTCQRELGRKPELICRPSPYLLPILTHHAAPQQRSDTDGLLTKLDIHWCKQTTQSVSTQHVAFTVNHFLPPSLGSPQICNPVWLF